METDEEVTRPLYKTTVVIWSEYPGDGDVIELSDLAREAEMGNAYCAKQESELVDEPDNDPAPPRNFFHRTEWDNPDEPSL